MCESTRQDTGVSMEDTYRRYYSGKYDDTENFTAVDEEDKRKKKQKELEDKLKGAPVIEETKKLRDRSRDTLKEYGE